MSKKTVLEYLLAVGATLLALLARFALDPLFGDHLPYITFFVAAVVMGYHGGLGASLTAVVLGGLAANWFFMSPRHSLLLESATQQAGYVAYFIAGLALVAFGHALRRAQRQAQAVMDGLRREVADRTRAEESLRETQATLLRAQRAAQAGLWEVDLRANRLIWSDAYYDLLGLDHSMEPSVAVWLSCIHPEDRERMETEYTRTIQQGSDQNVEFRIVRPDGSIRWVHRKGQMVCDDRGMPVRLSGITVDITDRKRAEEALCESEERFRTLADNMSQLAWMVDHSGGAVWFNRRWYEYTGTDLPQVQGWGWRSVHHPDHVERVVASWRRAFLTGGPWEETFPLRGSHGDYRWFLTRAVPIRDSEGSIIRWFGTHTDITELQTAEAALRESEGRLRSFADQLELLVAERTEELLQSQGQLRALATELNLTEQRERKRLAIELHDHLAQLLVLSKLKLSQMKQVPDLVPRCLGLIKEADDVLTQSLTYTRTLVADLAPPVLRDFGLPAALKWLGEQMQHRNVTVAVEVPDGHLQLPEDQAVLLFQSVRELLLNAAKHAGVCQATVSVEQDDNDLRIIVRDEGKGFDCAAVTAAGGPYRTSAMSSKLGLLSIRERMRALDGRFDLESAPGKGTTATLVLPLDGAAAAPSAVNGQGAMVRVEQAVIHQRSAISSKSVDASRITHHLPSSDRSAPITDHQSRIRVLLVDDHAMVRQGLRSVLESYADIEVVGEAANGEEAVAAVEQLHPSFVLMDINLPTMNGIEATAKITARHPPIVVIGLSVQTGCEAQEAMRKAGAASLLTKEAAVDELYRAIQDALSAKVVNE